MLRHVHVRNFAIVERLDLELEDGMTVFTGETGAGKSILVEALGLVLGDRAEATMVRSGSERAEITAGFAIEGNQAVEALLDEQGLEGDEGECLLRRQIGADGRSRGFVNGRPVPMQVLRDLGEMLVDIHGQHAHQSLLRRYMQRSLLDQYAGHTQALEAVSHAYAQWTAANEALADLNGPAGDLEARRELLRFQVRELEALAPDPGELEQLEQEHARLSNLTRILDGGQQSLEMLAGEEVSAGTLVGRSVRLLADLEDCDPRLGEITELLNNAAIELEEATGQLRHYVDSLELDPERLQQVEERLSALHTMARKHHVPIGELAGQLETLQRQLTELEQGEQRVQELQAQCDSALQAYRKAAAALHQSRACHARELSQAIAANMQQLGMPGGRFGIDVEADEQAEPAPSGVDRVEFKVSANPGQPLRPLNKVASGGELSRISLSIQVITARDKGIPTLVFDEVDVGIGGGVAEIVGQQLRALGGKRQVLCVTHLPQVAALSHHHVQVVKETLADNTRTRFEALAGKARVEEIARMLGGVEITTKTLAHARDMLTRSAAGS